MAFDKKPSTWLGAGYGVASHVAGFNTNDASSNKLLTDIVDADADPTTGDIRIVVFAFLECFYRKWLAQGANIPAKLKISRSVSTSSAGSITYAYTVRITVTPATVTVASE